MNAFSRVGASVLGAAAAALLVSSPAAAQSAAGNSACTGVEGGTLCAVPGGSYHIRLPEGDGPFPALMLLHNAGETGERMISEPLFVQTLLEVGFALIAPNGRIQRFADGSEAPGWRLSGTATGGRDDISFLEQVLRDAEADHRIDRDRVLLTGHGLGASLVWETACLAPEIASAYAPRNGGFYGALPESCAGPMRLMHVHAPVPGGWPLAEPRDTTIEGEAVAQPVQAHLDLAIAANGCTASRPLTGTLPTGFEGLAWEDCADDADLRLLLHTQSGRTTATLLSIMLAWFGSDVPDSDLGAADGAASGSDDVSSVSEQQEELTQ